MNASRGAKTPSPSGSGGVAELAGRSLRKAGSLLGSQAALEVLTVATLVGGGLMIMAEFLNLYSVERGVVVVQEQTGGEHHAYALLVAGVAVIGGTLLARATEAWPPAAAASGIGLAALALILLGDLPDATSSGLTAGARLAEAQPALGFWVELAGALLTIVSGALLARNLSK